MKIIKKLVAIGEGTQIAKRFDKATLVKILKGALISATGAVALYSLDLIGTIDFTNTNLAALVAFMVPFLVNIVKEYLKGAKK